MTKLLLGSLVTFAGLSIQAEPNQYKYLNRLSKNSNIKKKCEEINRWSLFNREAINACNLFDNMFNVYVEAHEDLEKISKKELLSLKNLDALAAEKLPTLEQIYKAMITLNTTNVEYEDLLLSVLMGDLANEEVNKLSESWQKNRFPY